MKTVKQYWELFNKPEGDEMKCDSPVVYISFQDLRVLGFDLLHKEVVSDRSNEEIIFSRNFKMKKHGKIFSKEEVDSFLWVLGMDTERRRFRISKKCIHRAKSTNKPVYDFMIRCEERTDPQWINSGNASLEAYYVGSKMKDMYSELHRMSGGRH